MKHVELVGDYHKVLRMIKNYSVEEIDGLVRGIQSYADMLRVADGEEEPNKDFAPGPDIELPKPMV